MADAHWSVGTGAAASKVRGRAVTLVSGMRDSLQGGREPDETTHSEV